MTNEAKEKMHELCMLYGLCDKFSGYLDNMEMCVNWCHYILETFCLCNVIPFILSLGERPEASWSLICYMPIIQSVFQGKKR